MARGSRYGRYDGGPDPLAPPVDIAEALDAIGQDVMAGYSPERAMREFLRRGGRDSAVVVPASAVQDWTPPTLRLNQDADQVAIPIEEAW